jgi:hypothetical protein
MDILNKFTDDVTEINISNKNIKGTLDCRCNEITSLNNILFLNNKGTESFSSENNIAPTIFQLLVRSTFCENDKPQTKFDISNSLIKLYCHCNKITNLDNLRFQNNKETEKKDITNSLIELNCSNNEIRNLDNFSTSLSGLYCDNKVKDCEKLMKKLVIMK